MFGAGMDAIARDDRMRAPSYTLCLYHAPAGSPGSDVLSAFSDTKSTTKTFTRSGTSMAVPHVAGVIAMYMQWNPKLTYDQIATELRNSAVQDVIFGILNSSNLLLSSAAIRKKTSVFVPAPTPPQAPLPPRSDIPTLFPRKDPANSAPSAPAQAEPQKKCKVLLKRCLVNADCCLNACRTLDMLGRRCFVF
jgi:hypothetical protein